MKEIILKDILKLLKNKTNRQYTFSIKKRAMTKYGLTPDDILNTPVLLILKYKGGKNK